ncbi:MAG: phasin family protein [Gammaproteobacteria bacterium]|nr:phasin family protein [Gammaproteobacteria bacterium]
MSTATFAAQAKDLAGPAKALNELALNKVDLLVDLQVQAVRRYASLVLDNWMYALTITDFDEARAFMEKQAAVAREAIDSMVADAQILSEMGQEYAEEVQSLITDNVAKVAKLN